MEIKLHKSTRGIWIYVDGKHKKTVPAIYEKMILEHINELSLDRKYLTNKEKEIFKLHIFKDALKVFLDNLKNTEPNVYRVIANANCTAARTVVPRNQINRYELCFDNNLKVKCKYDLYTLHPVQLPTAYLNY